jgi:Na+/phosphate symporter
MLILVLGLVGCTTIALAAYADSQAPRRVTLVGLWALAIALLAVVLVTPLHLIGVFSTPPVLALATASVATLSRRSPTP